MYLREPADRMGGERRDVYCTCGNPLTGWEVSGAMFIVPVGTRWPDGRWAARCLLYLCEPADQMGGDWRDVYCTCVSQLICWEGTGAMSIVPVWASWPALCLHILYLWAPADRMGGDRRDVSRLEGMLGSDLRQQNYMSSCLFSCNRHIRGNLERKSWIF